MLSYYPVNDDNRSNAKIREGFKVYHGSSKLALCHIIKKSLWSPIIWKNGVRAEKNFVSSQYAALDFEDPEIFMEDIENSFCDSWRIIGTTRNHLKVKGDKSAMERFRLLVQWERPITDLYQYKDNIHRLAKQFDADLSCTDGARLFFPCVDIYSCDISEDLCFETVREMTSHEIVREKYLKAAEFHNSYGRMSSFAARWLSNEIPEGQRNNTCLRLGCELYRAGLDYEDAVKRVLDSPTYKRNDLNHKLIKEVRTAILNGFNLAAKEEEKVKG